MAVKVEVTSGAPAADYPKLMESTASPLIVLFQASEQGVVVRSGHFYDLGEYRSDWTMETFSDFHGSITLSNA